MVREDWTLGGGQAHSGGHTDDVPWSSLKTYIILLTTATPKSLILKNENLTKR